MAPIEEGKASHLPRTIPSRFVAKSGLANRVGKLFVDYLRIVPTDRDGNAQARRARPGERSRGGRTCSNLATLKSGAQSTIATARATFIPDLDPWKGYWKAKQTLAGPMKKVDVPFSATTTSAGLYVRPTQSRPT